MEIDAELYRNYYRSIKEWKEREGIELLLLKRNQTAQQSWDEYIGLWELAMKFSSDDSGYQHSEHIKYLEDYYSKVQKLQAWMKSNGKKV